MSCKGTNTLSMSVAHIEEVYILLKEICTETILSKKYVKVSFALICVNKNVSYDRGV